MGIANPKYMVSFLTVLVKILLKGVIKPIKTLMVLNQLLPEVKTWEDAQKAAIRCETTLYETQASGGTLELPVKVYFTRPVFTELFT